MASSKGSRSNRDMHRMNRVLKTDISVSVMISLIWWRGMRVILIRPGPTSKKYEIG